MKKLQRKLIFPMDKGMDRTSIPGTQPASAIKSCKNVMLPNRPCIRKRPGLRRIPYSGDEGGVQGAVHWFATSGTAQKDEIVRVRKGRVEALRDLGGTRHFVDLGVQVSDSDRVTFERFENILIIHFENSEPFYYSIGGSLVDFPILSSHVTSPPGFSRCHDFRLWYGGRPADPHRLWASAPGDPFSFSLYDGGFSMRVRNGDGDPKGLTGLSPTFRGSLFAYKWMAIYRIYASAYGYAIDQVTDAAGAVHHNAICGTQNDVYSVDSSAIRSLTMTSNYGAVDAATATWPIYEWFQEEINWSAYSKMVLTYDAYSNTLFLSYASSGSSVNNRVLGVNLSGPKFFMWDDCEYPDMGRYVEFGKPYVFVSDETRGCCILDPEVNTLDGDPINLSVDFGTIFPAGDPASRVTMTNGWLLAKPTQQSVEVSVSYRLDGNQEVTKTVDTEGGQWGGVIGTDLIGEGLIGQIDEDLIALPFELVGECSSVKFALKQEPPENDPDQPCEIYGILYEFEYDEDTEKTVSQ